MRLCGFEVGLNRPLFLIAGPCVVESEQLQIDVAGRLKEICAALRVPFIFKSSYDKANRSSSKSFRGLGMEEGLRILGEVRRQVGVPVLTDVHAEDEIAAVASVVDVLQTPAFLCRQTDFICAVAASGKPVNIKKGQFLAPEDMSNVVAKAREAGGDDNILVCERGASFGYHNLVSDMRSLAILRVTGCPVVFDATHSVQLPGDRGHRAAVSASSFRCSRGRRWPRVSPVSSWRRIPTRPKRSRTARMRGRWARCANCCKRCATSTPL